MGTTPFEFMETEYEGMVNRWVLAPLVGLDNHNTEVMLLMS